MKNRNFLNSWRYKRTFTTSNYFLACVIKIIQADTPTHIFHSLILIISYIQAILMSETKTELKLEQNSENI